MTALRRSPYALYVTLVVTALLTVGLIALLARPGADLKPSRAATFELDEPR